MQKLVQDEPAGCLITLWVDWSLGGGELTVGSVWNNLSLLLEGDVLLAGEARESVLLGDVDLLSSWELELGTAEGLDDVVGVDVLATDGDEDLSNLDTGDVSDWLSEGSSHSGLESIGSGAGKHLVDADDVEWMDSHSHVEGVLSGHLGDVLVGTDTGSLESLGGDLLELSGEEMDARWELINVSSLSSEIEDTETGIWDSTAEAGLDVWLSSTVSVALGWTATHFRC